MPKDIIIVPYGEMDYSRLFFTQKKFAQKIQKYTQLKDYQNQ